MIKPTDLKPASYNPRVMDDLADDALSVSMDTFSDISGITYNKKSGNIVTGHHRWEQLIEKYSLKKLKFSKIEGTDRYLIHTIKNKFTGYILRTVDWTDAMEKSANVTANSHAVEGEFTIGLQDVLSDIRLDTDFDTLFTDLRLDELEVDLAPDMVEKEPELEKSKKSETMISGGGDKYITVKLELSPELSDRLFNQLDRFKLVSGSVESSLAMIISFIEWSNDKDVLRFKKKSIIKTDKRNRKKRSRN